MALTEDKQALNKTNGKIEPSKVCVYKADTSRIKATKFDASHAVFGHIDDMDKLVAKCNV